MSAVALRNAFEELATRFKRGKGIGAVLERLFDKQREVLGCRARKIAAMCTRRAGKTTLIPAALFSKAEENPDCVILCLGRTRIRAKQLNWQHLIDLNSTYELGYKVNHSELTLTHPSNGAVIRLYGATDSNVADRVRGDKLAFVVIDESQMIPDEVLRMLVDEVLWPALLDVSGQLLLLGTPGYRFAGLWYEITRNDEDGEDGGAASRSERASGWEVFEWSGLDNPSVNHKGQRICDLFREELAALEADPAKGPRYPKTIREFRGRWCEGSEDLFYAFLEARNTWAGGVLPDGHAWNYGMGVDLGKSAFAIVVLAYSETHPVIYEVDGLKVRKVNANDWRRLTSDFLEKWNPDFCAVDYGGLGIASIEAWQEEGLAVEPAEKGERDAYVFMMNAEMELGNVKAVKGSALAKEWANLPIDPDSPPGKPPQPAEGFDDHSADGALYAWRKAYRLAGREDKPAPQPSSAEAQRAWMEKQQDEYLAKMARRKRGNLLR